MRLVLCGRVPIFDYSAGSLIEARMSFWEEVFAVVIAITIADLIKFVVKDVLK